MAIDGIGASSYAYGVGSYKSAAVSSTDDSTGLGSAERQFLTEAKKTPAQRFREQWLKAHNLTEEKLASKTPEERSAIEKSIADDMKKQLAAKKDQRGGLVDMAA